MKKRVFVSAFLALLLGWEPLALAQDPGVPDTLYVEVHAPDVQPSKGHYFVRFPIRVTHDIVDDVVDSLAAFVIPLCYNHSNPAAYCSLSSWWNTTSLNPFDPQMARSIFRELGGETNWFDSIYSWLYPPDVLFLDLDGTSHFWLRFVPVGSQDPRMPEVSRGLLATMTFRLDDSTTICIDSCFWPPSSRLLFANSIAQPYVPRHNMPICEPVGVNPGPPYFLECPGEESHSENGSGFTSSPFSVETYPPGGEITEVGVEFIEPGLDNVSVVYTVPPPAEHVAGYVTYDVVDHCGPNVVVSIVALDHHQRPGECGFLVELLNDPPALSLADTVFFIGGSTGGVRVPATDANDDAVEVSFNGLWYEPDSLRPPVNLPSFTPGNPGLLVWNATETEEGPWICSFTATDVCGAEATGEMTILVGPLFCGDNTNDSSLDVSDVIMLLGYLYKAGAPPEPLCKGDANCDGVGDIGDVICLLNYLFRYGSAPCFDCCAGGF
jgi:hypothetical protein